MIARCAPSPPFFLPPFSSFFFLAGYVSSMASSDRRLAKSRTCSPVEVECLYKKYKGVVTNHGKS
jgi:hypothetical protein